MSYFSRVTYTGNGSQTLYTVPFPYISKSHVEVRLNGSLTSAYIWNTSGVIQLNSPPSNGTSIEIRRSTPIDTKLVDFNDASSLTEDDLDTTSDQLLFAFQEVLDASSGNLTYSPPSSTSTVFIQTGAGAIPRSYQEKLSDLKSIFDYGGKGDGSTDDTAAVQAAITANKHVEIPDGYVFKCTNTLNVANVNTRLYGKGELRFTSAISGKAAINVTADGFEADGIYITNPTHDSPKTGNRTYGIYIAANNAYVHGCTIDGFQNGITGAANGEFFNYRITDNFILNVAGAGDGPSNTTSILGEDRGDGIVVWGAVGTISGNLVTALAGSDARCGIFVEALSGFEGSTPTDSDGNFTISNNIVRGPFRRSIDSEGLVSVSITGNDCLAGNWGGIQVSAISDQVVVSSNTVRYSRAITDLTGQAYTPWRCGIVIYANAKNTVISGNAVTITGYGDGIFVSGTSGSRGANHNITGNTVNFPNGPNGIGIKIQYCDSPLISSNKIINSGSYTSNSYYGIYAYDVTHPEIVGNHINVGVGPGGYTAEAVHLESNTIGALVNSNTITGAKTGITAFNKSYMSVQNNRFVGVTAAGDLFGCSSSVITGNLLGGATAFANIANGVSSCIVANNAA